MPSLPGTALVMKAAGESARPIFDASRVYRDAHARYAQAFERGDVSAIEEEGGVQFPGDRMEIAIPFHYVPAGVEAQLAEVRHHPMQDLRRAFRDGAQWAEENMSGRKGRPR